MTGTVLEVLRDSVWTDITPRMLRLRWRTSASQLEELSFEAVGVELEVGERVRLRRAGEAVFEGIIYEKEREHSSRGLLVRARAYSLLILYDRHIVYRSYPTGTAAGEIIRDLASLEPGVDTSGVEDGPRLTSVWEIENETALKIMQGVARGTNYLLYMRPGLRLQFKPKEGAQPSTTIDESRILSASYREDRWSLRNRVIYVGAGGQVLADVSEPPGDMPLVISDPFLTDHTEAQRRAQIRLTLNKEYGRSLRLSLHERVYEELGLGLGQAARLEIPSLGLDGAVMFVVGVEYDPAGSVYLLDMGGRLELFEDYLSETMGGDVAARFGGRAGVPEMLSTLAATSSELEGYARVSASTRHPAYVNRPPLTLYNPQNIILNAAGEAELVSGATSGSFETRILPPSGLTFLSFVEAYWDAYAGGGSVSAEIINVDEDVILRISDAVATRHVVLPRWPRALNHLTYRSASRWAASGATVSDVRLGPVGGWCLKIVPDTLGTYGTITYPASGNLSLQLQQFRYLRLYLYGGHTDSFAVKIQLWQDASNYLEGSLVVALGEWRKYEAALKTFIRVGNPATINWISVSSPYTLLIDSDHVLLGHVYEVMRLRFTLFRPSAADESPRVGAIRMVWREGGA
jgi:Phage late control gene D protein (GPD).